MAQKAKTVARLTTLSDDAEVLSYMHDIALAEAKRRSGIARPGVALIRRVGAGLRYFFPSLDLHITLQASIGCDDAQLVAVPDGLPTDPYLQTAEAEAEQADIPA